AQPGPRPDDRARGRPKRRVAPPAEVKFSSHGAYSAEGCKYRCPSSCSSSVVLVDEASEPVATDHLKLLLGESAPTAEPRALYRRIVRCPTRQRWCAARRVGGSEQVSVRARGSL